MAHTKPGLGARELAVMKIVWRFEEASVRDIFYNPQHPYTHGLLRSTPRLDEASSGELRTIPGQPPNLQRLPPGCAFNERCAWRMERCLAEEPAFREVGEGRRKACHLEHLDPTA